MEYSEIEILRANYISALAFFIGVSNFISVAVLCYVRRTHRQAFIWLAFMALSFAMWDLPRAVFCLATNEYVAKYFFRLSYIGVAFAGPTFFLFAYMNIFSPKKNPKWIYAIFVIPITTSIITIFPPLQNFLEIYEQGFRFTPSRELINHFQPFFYIHSVYSYGLTVLGATLFFVQLLKKDGRNKISCAITCSISTIFIVWNIYATFFAVHNVLYRCITVFLRMVVVYGFFLTMYLDEDEILAYSGQKDLFAMIPFPVFIVNSRRRIVYSNFEASLLIPYEKKNGASASFDDVLSQFDVTNMELPPENGGGVVVHIKRGTQDFFLNETVIYGARKKSSAQGKLIMLVTHSEFTFFFKDLEMRAFHDGLCKCFNRHYLELKKKDFLSDDVLPLSLLVCDLDGAKTVNDTYGHNAGDEYITMTAAAINSCIRTTDFLFRLGSDEFLAVMPNIPAKVAEDIKHRLKLEVEMRGEELSYPASVSVGVYTITSMPIDFSAAMHLADEAMYAEKKGKRGE